MFTGGKGVASAAEAPSPRANYEKLAAERTAKIQRYKEQKELERKLKVSTYPLQYYILHVYVPSCFHWGNYIS